MVGDKIGQPDVDERETRMCLYTRSENTEEISRFEEIRVFTA